MFPLQRLAGRVLRHHVGGDEDVLGADQRLVDEDVGDGRRRGCGCRRDDKIRNRSLWRGKEIDCDSVTEFLQRNFSILSCNQHKLNSLQCDLYLTLVHASVPL